MATKNSSNIGLTPSGSATVTFPASTSTLATLALSETLTNKTLTTPALTTPTVSGVKYAVTSKTANYTATATDGTIYCDATGGAFTITLPAVSGNTGLQFNIVRKNTTGGNVTIDANGTELIEAAETYVMQAANEFIIIQTDGTKWYIVK